jgi:hypothetical protein
MAVVGPSLTVNVPAYEPSSLRSVISAPHLDRPDLDAVQQIARAGVASQQADAVVQGAPEHDRVAGLAVVHRPDGVDAGGRGFDDRRDRRGRHARLVAERHDDGVARSQRRDAGAQRRGHPLGPVLALDDLGAGEVHRRAHGAGAGAQHDHDAVDAARGEHRADGVLEQRDAVELGQLLGRAEAPGGARGEHQAAGHAPTPPSSRSASSSSERSELPARKWSVCGRAAAIPRTSGS